MCKIPELLDRAKELGMESLAITDHGVMYGAIEFYLEAKKRGIKPIIGFESYIAPRKLTDKEGKIDTRPGHLVLLARNETGYKNLMKLTSVAHLEGYYYKPRIDKEVLKKYSEGLIALSACGSSGVVGRHLRDGNYEKAKEAALEYKNLFEEGNFYLEIQYVHSGFPEQEEINKGIKKIAKETGIPLVVTNDVHYINKDDAEAQDVLLCLQTGAFVNDENRMRMEGNQSLISPKEMEEAFQDTSEALENTAKIADMCNLELDLGKILIPDFKITEGETVREYLRKLVDEGLKKRYSEVTEKIKERAKYELSVIEKMGFESYFLIVWDFVKWAKDHGIVVGPGRGSAAGSIVSYVLDITEINPLEYDLFFERFLNPDRISMPDIDMDFADDRRSEVIDYVSKKYGSEHVAQIITFGTMKAKNAIRDTGRVLGFPYTEVDRVAKMVPEIINIKLKDAIDTTEELKKEYKNDSKIKHLLDLAMKLEGVARHSSTHAAGVVISQEPLIFYTPVQRATKGDISINTQYSMNPLESIGLLKMDFLGLSNLTVIKNTLRIVKKVYDTEIDISKLPLDDEKTFELLGKADTTGVFQLESAGMKKNIRELKPTVFEDIIAMVALYRPGPMQFIPDFIKRKHGKQKISYDHPLMEEALSTTYGIMVYQEQVIRLAKDMAGFTGGEADTLRKAMGKKIAALMKKMRVKFIEGSVKNGVKEKVAIKIFYDLENFSQYAFNKSHAACYALITYQTAYLKAHFPSAFMAALMTSDYGNIDRIAIEIDECRRMGLEVLPPDINESFAEFAVVKDSGKIRFGMKAIKNVGMGIIEAIIKAREEEGNFTSIIEFLNRVEAKEVNKKVMESLVKSGAFDSIGEREDLLHNLEKILAYSNKIKRDGLSGQTDLFGSNGINIPDIHLEKAFRKPTKKEKLDWEKELLGVYISDHPLRGMMHILGRERVIPCSDFSEVFEKAEIKVGGIITSVQKIYTRNKEQMLFARLEDAVGNVELVVFPKVLSRLPNKFQEGKILIVSGRFNSKEGAPKLLVDNAKEISLDNSSGTEEIVLFNDRQIDIFLPEGAGKSCLEELKRYLLINRGTTPTFLHISNEGPDKKIKLPFGVRPVSSMKEKIENILKIGTLPDDQTF